MEKKKILIPGGRLSDWALVNAAHKLGLYVITSGYRPEDPAHKFSDKYIQADYSDKEAMLKIAKEEKIDYMCSNSNDFGLLSTAYVCEKLGLPGHDSYDTTIKLHTKDSFKKMAKELKLHSPISEIFDNPKDAIEFLNNTDKEYIIKPADNVGSVGVSRPKSKSEIEEKVKLAFDNSKNGKIIVEPYIEGFFAPVAAFIINEKVVAFFTEGYFDYPQGRVKGQEFPIFSHASGYVVPSPYQNEFSQYIIEDINKIAKHLHLVDGKFHCELLITPQHEAYIFDLHRRMSGYFNPWSQWDFSKEICWEDWIVKSECGMDLSDFPLGIRQNKYMHSRNIYAPKNGIIKRIVFDEYLTSHIYPKFEGKNYILNNIFVTDFMNKPVIEALHFVEEKYLTAAGNQLIFMFDNKEECEKIGLPSSEEIYSHIKFEYADQY